MVKLCSFLCLFVVRAVLDSPLCMKSYSKRFHLLLYLEEIQMEVDIKKYDMHAQTMTQDKSNKRLLILKVRDSLLYPCQFVCRKKSE